MSFNASAICINNYTYKYKIDLRLNRQAKKEEFFIEERKEIIWQEI
jgi:hypothetical protein